MSLTAKQKAWADNYVVCLNATEAARRAGYAGDDNTLAVIGSQNLRNHKVSAYVNELMKAATISAENVLYRISEMATATIEDFIDIKGGVPYFNFEKAKKANKLHLVNLRYSDKTGQLVGIELPDRLSALVHLGKVYALFTNKTEIVTWETKALEYIRDGKIKFPAAVAEFGEDLAANLFKKAGVVPVEAE